jgi:hypothetical protein
MFIELRSKSNLSSVRSEMSATRGSHISLLRELEIPGDGFKASSGFARKVAFLSPRFSGRLKIAQRFIAGIAGVRD